MNSHITFGKRSELYISNLLQKDDFVILEQNYKKFFGEIDIIAKKKDLVIFVEVKARKNPKTSMFELVSPSKQQKIIQTAQAYISEQQLDNITYRFDVALVESDGTQIINTIYIPHAFCA